jgi:DNA-binding NarL/FixJ family response regulator
LSPWVSEVGLEIILVGQQQAEDVCETLLSPEVVACVYVVGGTSLHPQVIAVLKHCLDFLGSRPLILFVDEADSGSIDLAIELGIRGVIPTRMTTDVAIAAVQDILSGGHYYPHSAQPKLGAPHWLPRGKQEEPAPLPPIVGQHLSPPEVPRASRPETLLPALYGAQRWVARTGVNGRAAASIHDGGSFDDKPDERSFVPGRDVVVHGRIFDDGSAEIQVRGRRMILTRRQHEVLSSLERGLSNKAIGRELNITESAVKQHVRELMRKLAVSNRTQIALMVLPSPETETSHGPSWRSAIPG